MKTRTILALALVLSLLLGVVVMATETTGPTTEQGVDPAFYEMCRDAGQHPDLPDLDCFITTGDAYYECNQIGEYDFAKRIGAVEVGSEGQVFPLMDKGLWLQDVTLLNCDGHIFDWAADPNAVGSVIVKSVGKGMLSGGYNVYNYDPAALWDAGLTGVEMAKVKGKEGSADLYLFDINHITFCWNLAGVCVEDETAWAAGDPYVEQGSWAMYVDYYAQEAPFTVDLLAGQNLDAGEVTFSAPYDIAGEEWIDITIELADEWVFYYDVDDIETDDNIKVQDYNAPPPAKNPAIGLFDWKASIDPGETEATITVPLNNYYGVHVDLGHAVECP